MAARKGGGLQLQIEVNTEEEWEALLEKPGLIVCDIYSGWCGPCVGMVANLKKIKLEIGGDTLILATVKSDKIAVLERFRERSEPCWMFISGRKIVNLLIGANAPRLMKLIANELDKEKAAERSGRPRDGTGFEVLTPAEVERNDYEKKREEGRKAKTEETEKQKRKERHEKDVAKMIHELQSESVVLLLPFTYDKETKDWPSLNTLMEMLGTDYYIKQQEELDLTVQDAQKIFNIFYDEEEEDEEEEDLIDDLKEQLEKGKSVAVLISLMGAPTPTSEPSDVLLNQAAGGAPPPPEEKPEEKVNVMKVIYEAVYGAPEDEEDEEDDEDGEEKFEEGDEAQRSILAHLTEEYGWMTAIPGVWAPKSVRELAEAVLVLFKDFSETIVGPPPPVLPPHVAIAFDAKTYPEIQETLGEYEEKVIKSGFFNSHDPDAARKVADNYDELHLIMRTGTEQFVIMLDNSKSEALLALAQFGPTFVSQDQEEGKEDCMKFFPDDEKERPAEEGPEIKLTDYDEGSLELQKEEDSLADYDPLALRETKKDDQIPEITSIVSGFEEGGSKTPSVAGGPEAKEIPGEADDLKPPELVDEGSEPRLAEGAEGAGGAEAQPEEGVDGAQPEAPPPPPDEGAEGKPPEEAGGAGAAAPPGEEAKPAEGEEPKPAEEKKSLAAEGKKSMAAGGEEKPPAAGEEEKKKSVAAEGEEKKIEAGAEGEAPPPEPPTEGA